MKSKRALPNWIPRIAKAAALLAVSVNPAGASPLADFEGGLPFTWFTFFGGSTVTTGTQVVADTDPLARPGHLPPSGRHQPPLPLPRRHPRRQTGLLRPVEKTMENIIRRVAGTFVS